MFNLLPTKEKTDVYKQYKMRRLVVLFVFVLVALGISITFIIPSYILTLHKAEEIETEILYIEDKLQQKNKDELNDEIMRLNEKIAIITPKNKTHAQFYDLIEGAISKKPLGVHVTGVQLQTASKETVGENGYVYKLQLVGVSDRRDDIVLYTETLKNSGQYQSVVLPVESLAKQFDNDFSLTIEIAS